MFFEVNLVYLLFLSQRLEDLLRFECIVDLLLFGCIQFEPFLRKDHFANL